MTSKQDSKQAETTSTVKRPAKQDTPLTSAVDGLKKLGYKVEAWEDKDRQLFFFRTEKDEVKRIMSVSLAELESDGFVRNFAARL